MKKTGILLVVLAILLIASGLCYTLFLQPTGGKEKKEKVIEEKRNYTVVEKVDENSLNVVCTPDTFSSLATKIGFQNPNCSGVTDNPNSKFCNASYFGYTNLDFQDIIAATFDGNLLNQFSMTINFTKQDFNVNNVTEKSNAVLNNFFGTNINTTDISDVINSLNASMSEEEPVAAKEVQLGNYVEQINMQYVKDSNIYVVRYYILLASDYHIQ